MQLHCVTYERIQMLANHSKYDSQYRNRTTAHAKRAVQPTLLYGCNAPCT